MHIPPFQLTHQVRLDLWSAARMQPATFGSLCARGLHKKRKNCASTIVRRFMKHHLSCQCLPERRLTDKEKNTWKTLKCIFVWYQIIPLLYFYPHEYIPFPNTINQSKIRNICHESSCSEPVSTVEKK